jgi:formamidopyrimidine-DNA glycosylase
VYLDALASRIGGERLERVRVFNPFVLRTVEPAPSAVEGREVTGLRRVGKRVVIAMEGELFIVIHLMIAGRFRWLAPGAVAPKSIALAALDFPTGTLVLTEAGTTRRASLSIVQGEAALQAMDRGGINVLEVSLDAFTERLRSENHTLKRALTDPRLFEGIGNAYSDEILHRAKLSPVALSQKLDEGAIRNLYDAIRAVMAEWTQSLRAEANGGFPEKVTAFRPGMAVHGRFGKPCPACGTAVQRIRYADNETNYCPRCQTNGKILADRSLSRLLKDDWPRTIEELERL